MLILNNKGIIMNDILEFDPKYELSILIDEKSLVDGEQLPISKKHTKSFRRFYLETILAESIFAETLVNESPSRAGGFFKTHLNEWIYNTAEAKDYIEGRKGKFVENFYYRGDIAIYRNDFIDPKDKSNITEYALIVKSQEIIIGHMRLINTKNVAGKDIVLTNGLWNDMTSGSGVIFAFMTKWLLPKYKLIISDNYTGKLGENFWWKIIEYGLTNNKNCGIYILADPLSGRSEYVKRLYKKLHFEDAWNKSGGSKRIYISE
jgi:hypothetical protein